MDNCYCVMQIFVDLFDPGKELLQRVNPLVPGLVRTDT
jgi:hypothetical protein